MAMSRTLAAIGVAAAVAIALFLTFEWTHKPSSQPISMSDRVISQPQIPNMLTWREFMAPSGKFKAIFPTLPQRAGQTLEDPKTKEQRQYDMYVSEGENGNLFMISIIRMLDKPNAKINETVMSSVINELLTANPDSKINKMEISKYKDYPSMNFSIAGNQVNIDGKAFLAGNTLYVLTYAAKPNNYKPNEFDYFLSSFQLTPENEKAAIDNQTK